MSLPKLAESLRALALAYPETYEEQPWGDRVVKVRGKIFFFCGVREDKLHATVKLPSSGRAVLQRPDAAPTHYGMGKHGWVSLTFSDEKKVPLDELRAWLDESFRAVAPKKLAAEQPSAVSRQPSAPQGKKPEKKKPEGKKPKKEGAGLVLVCGDALRAGRAVAALGERGVRVEVAAAAAVALGRVRALIVDIGRNPIEGIALAERVDGADRAVHLFVTGVRDAAQARKLRALGSAECFRAPPGDPAVVEAVVAALSPSKAKRGARPAP